MIIAVKTDKAGRFLDCTPYTVLTKALEDEGCQDSYGVAAKAIRDNGSHAYTGGEVDVKFLKREEVKGDYKAAGQADS